MRRSHLVNYVLYQTGWFSCVLGAAQGWPWTGSAAAVILTGAHLALARDRRLEARLVLLSTSIGAVVEAFQMWSGTYRFPPGAAASLLAPPWLFAIWAQFATTFRFCLVRVITRPWMAALFGAIGGPVAFLAGERLGAVVLLAPRTAGLVRLSVVWAVALTGLSLVVRAVTPEGDVPSYRHLTDHHEDMKNMKP